MTLIVYKNNELAGDSRGTVSNVVFDKDDRCGHCGEDAHVVADTGTKITLAASKDIKFRGDKILAVGQCGNRALSRRMVSMLMEGKDMEECYKIHRAFLPPNAENTFTFALVICCEKKNYILDMPKKGNLIVTEVEKDKFIAMGSSVRVAEWIDAMMPDSTAASIINLIMARDKSIGGDIKKVDLSKPSLLLIGHDKKDPATLLKGATHLFALGKEAVNKEEAKKAPRKTTTKKKEE